VLKEQKDWSAEALDATVLPWIEQQGYGLGIVMNAFRICLVGAARGPHIWAITDVLGKDEVIRRVEVAIKRLQ
jgi:glutamyl-tRNA synthetase